MKRSKPVDITIKINTRRRRKGVQKSLPPYLLQRLESVLKREVRTAKEHFAKKGHGWDLSYRLLYANVMQDVLGADLEWYVLGRFLKVGDWKWKKSRWGGEEDYLCKRSRDPLKRSKRVKKRPIKKVS